MLANRNIRKLKKVSKILSKMEWKQSNKEQQDKELITLCRKLLNELDYYVSEKTEVRILRHYRYFTFNVDDIKNIKE